MSRTADAETLLARAEEGDECPLCHNGTVELRSVPWVPSMGMVLDPREARCRGRSGCGAVTRAQNG